CSAVAGGGGGGSGNAGGGADVTAPFPTSAVTATASTTASRATAAAANAAVATDRGIDSASRSSSGGGNGDGAASAGSTTASGLSYTGSDTRSLPRRPRTREVAIVALDLDGTLLDSRSRILPSSAAAIRAAVAAGVLVVAATGKARPAALAAAASAGGEGGEGFSTCRGVSLCAFLGDTCATPQLTNDIRELHTTYYEPLAEVVQSAASLLTGPPVRKLLFMTDPSTVTQELLPYWTKELEGSGAQVLQAVPNMLEIVPSGINKWAGVRRLLDHLDLPPSALMAVGDGGNDLEMVAGAGLGVAMGNAVPAVRAAAAAVVAGHNEGGVAEAFERFVLP
ncbi:hypothetical protein VOLCADRAFT_100503, partial [Volvox carteri f. nagariensis]